MYFFGRFFFLYKINLLLKKKFKLTRLAKSIRNSDYVNFFLALIKTQFKKKLKIKIS